MGENIQTILDFKTQNTSLTNRQNKLDELIKPCRTRQKPTKGSAFDQPLLPLM